MKVVHHHFASIPSTNTWAKEHLKTFDRNSLTVISADEQTKGRGRFKRHWISPPEGNLYASFCFFLKQETPDIAHLSQVMAFSIAHMLEKLNFSPKLKWPNDVFMNGKKVAGILCETTPCQQDIGIIIGVGLNINMPSAVLDQVDQPATSLSVEQGTAFDVSTIAKALQKEFIKNVEAFLRQGFKMNVTNWVSQPNLDAL